MASQPPIDYLGAMGGLAGQPNPLASFYQGLNMAQRASQGQNVLQDQQFALQQAQQKAQQQQQAQDQYKQDIATVTANPTVENFSNAVLRNPAQAAQIKDAWEMQSKDAQSSNLQHWSGIYALTSNGRYDDAADEAESWIAAANKAGKPEPGLEHIPELLRSGDPAQQKQALGLLGYGLSAIMGPDKFNETLGSIGQAANKDSSVVVSAGGALVRKSDGQVLYQANDKPQYEKVKDANGNDIIVQVGGGSPSATGAPSASGQRFTGGWTPRAVNGGDNSDAAVDNKIAGAAKMLGVDPNADISQLPPTQLAQAMTYGEGGVGTLAGRNNNPANLRNKDGSYKVFPTPQAGLNAAAALVARKVKNGQTTVKSLIEGLPVGGPASASGAQPNSKIVYQSGGGDPNAAGPFGINPNLTGPAVIAALPKSVAGRVQQLLDGRSLLTAREKGQPMGQQILAAANQADPTYDESVAPARFAAAKQFTGNGKAAQVASSGNRLAYHLNDLYRDSLALSGPDTGWSLLNNTLASSGQAFQPAAAARYDAVLPFIAGELQKLTKNGASTEFETKQIMSNLGRKQSTTTRNAAIQQVVELAEGQFKPFRDQYQSVFGENKSPPVDFTPTTRAIFQHIKNGDVPITVDGNGHVIQSRGAQGQTAQAAPQPTRIARNPQTGQRIGLVNGKWVPIS